MNELLTIINFSLLTILFLLYIVSLVIEIVCVIKEEYNLNFVIYILDSIISFIMIIITIILGFASIYSSSKDKLFIYIIIILIVLCTKILFSILLFNTIKERQLSFIIFIILIIQIIIIFLNFISSLYERKKIVEEIEESPLNYVDETITEDMYKSILSQCLNPEDKKLKKEFKKQLKKRKNQIKISLNSYSSENISKSN